MYTFRNINTINELLIHAQEEQITAIDPLDRSTSLLETFEQTRIEVDKLGGALVTMWDTAQNDNILLEWLVPILNDVEELIKYSDSIKQIIVQLSKEAEIPQELINLTDRFDLILERIYESIRLSPEGYSSFVENTIVPIFVDLNNSLIDNFLPELQETHRTPTKQLEYSGWNIEQKTTTEGNPIYSLSRRLNPDKAKLMPVEEYKGEDLEIIKNIINIIEEKQIEQYEREAI